ncbi:MAG TPA: pilus assembly protein TadG-related protein [Candidatus Limnocylindrales bacterium]|nr:pilus assembly protein TadG-related protein [Candidatus Limnocylindrales bacterium]
MMRDDRGSAAILVVLMLPLLLTTVTGVIQLGAIRVLAARVASAADLATLAATDDQDAAELVGAGRLALAPDAEAVARKYFALNLAHISPHLAITADAAAARADIALFPQAPATDPLTGWRYDRPTVRIAASVPILTPAFGSLFAPVTVVNVRAASAAR